MKFSIYILVFISFIVEFKCYSQNEVVGYKDYYPNSSIKEEGKVWPDSSGRQLYHGTIKTYYKKGSLKSTVTYNKGVIVDTALFYSPKGKLLERQIQTSLNTALIESFNSHGKIKLKGFARDGNHFGLINY